MKLNATPVRTSNNFKINDIELKDFKTPNEITEFSNRSIYINSDREVLIVNESSANAENPDELFNDNRLIVSKAPKDDFKLKYGIGNELFSTLSNSINQQLRIVAKENSEKSDVNIEFYFDENNVSLNDRIEIYAEKNSNIDVVINYIPKTYNDEFANYNKNQECMNNKLVNDTTKYFHNGIIKVCGLENSKVNVTVINLLNNESDNFISFENKLLEDAILDYTIVDFGGKNSITNYYTDLFGAKSFNNLSSIYLGNDSQLFDLNYIAHCRGEKSHINIEVQGALKDYAKKNFKGTIDFKKGCKKAVGNENENCLLLSDTAKSIALPMLLCSEEDVEGNHSSSSGKADNKELFYMMTRGLSEMDAMKLLVRARFNKILDNILDSETRELVQSFIEIKLS